MATNERKTADWYKENMMCLFAAAVALLGCVPIFLVAYMAGQVSQVSGASIFQTIAAVWAIIASVCGLGSFIAACWMAVCYLLAPQQT